MGVYSVPQSRNAQRMRTCCPSFAGLQFWRFAAGGNTNTLEGEASRVPVDLHQYG